MKPLIKLENISKIYPLDGVTIPALTNINLAINKGEFVSIMGPSGSGKSTLMNLIGLLDIPTEGRIYLKGEDVSKLNSLKRAELRRKTIGFVFQQFNLLPRITALENVILPLLYCREEKNERKKKGIQMLKEVGLGERTDHRPTQLSGGQQQRVAIARALINDPQIILADEPTGNIDTKTGSQIMNILSRLHKKGNTIITITHEKRIADYAQKTLNLIDGKIV